MKVFHELAYEGYVLADAISGAFIYGDPRLQELMGAVDVLHVSGYSAQVSGTTPQLNVQIEYSTDRNHWRALNFASPVINALTLSTSGETLFQATEPLAPMARLAYGRLRIWVAGTNAQAFLRIWVTGRDLSRRSAGAPRAQAQSGSTGAMAPSAMAPSPMAPSPMAPGAVVPIGARIAPRVRSLSAPPNAMYGRKV